MRPEEAWPSTLQHEGGSRARMSSGRDALPALKVTTCSNSSARSSGKASAEGRDRSSPRRGTPLLPLLDAQPGPVANIFTRMRPTGAALQSAGGATPLASLPAPEAAVEREAAVISSDSG